MKFALYSLAVLALSSYGLNGFARAEDEGAVDDVKPLPIDTDALVEPEKIEFQAEVTRILDIVINSLYQNKDVFLRELISNASDALDKMRFLSITHPEMLGDKPELEIRVQYDVDDGVLIITDSGVGMTKQDLVENLGTVARSGTTRFMDALAEGADVEQIGMFGVGFYSAFLVANQVTVASKSPDSDKQYIWMGDNGQNSFTVAEDPRGNTLGRGTEITLHVKGDAMQYLAWFKINELVQHYSEFVTHPIFVRKTTMSQVPEENPFDFDEKKEGEEGEEGEDEEASTDTSESDDIDISEEEDSEFVETVDENGVKKSSTSKQIKMKSVTTHSWEKCNADAAIWNRGKDDISDEEYNKFFQLIAKTNSNATDWTHFDAEGNINFKALVYLPTEIPAKLRAGDVATAKSAIKLYVRKVLISDEFDLLPRYLSFVTGVVDSNDLPLNVNRETLQESKIIAIIRKKVTRKVLDALKRFAEQDWEPEELEENGTTEIDEEGNPLEKKEPDEHPYIKWYKKFAPSVKMGIMEDEPNRKRIAKLIRIQTSKSGDDWITFADYVDGMKDWQKDIYFIAGTDIDELKESPFMEAFLEKDVEVIYFTEAADEYMVQHMRDYNGKKFTPISKEGVSIESDEERDEEIRRYKVYDETYKNLTKFMNKFYGRRVMSVSVSRRLGKVPAIATSSSYGQTANMERIMRAQAFAHDNNDRFLIDGMKTLEINPRHPFIEKLNSVIEEAETDTDRLVLTETLPQDLKDAFWNLFDTALLNGGYPVSEGKGFTNRMLRSIKLQLDVDSLKLSPKIEVPLEDDEPPEIDEAEDLDDLSDITDEL